MSESLHSWRHNLDSEKEGRGRNRNPCFLLTCCLECSSQARVPKGPGQMVAPPHGKREGQRPGFTHHLLSCKKNGVNGPQTAPPPPPSPLCRPKKFSSSGQHQPFLKCQHCQSPGLAFRSPTSSTASTQAIPFYLLPPTASPLELQEPLSPEFQPSELLHLNVLFFFFFFWTFLSCQNPTQSFKTLPKDPVSSEVFPDPSELP